MPEPRIIFSLLVLWLVSNAAGAGNSGQPAKVTPPFLRINLRDLGYRPEHEYRYPGTGVPPDLSVLFDDYHIRLTFINERTFAVYQSHYPPPSATDRLPSRSMESFFADAKSGTLTSHKTWATVKRKWFNERWDTQARILPVEKGFLVHAGDALILYSTNVREKAELPLDEHFSWAATIAPMGHTVHLERIDRERADGLADGEWLDSGNLARLREQQEFAGMVSASDYATVDKLAHCMQLQRVGESPRNLCCSAGCRLGLPLFLSESEVLSVYRNGFSVLSTNGDRLWSREATDGKNGLMASHKRSLDGNRFAISLRGDRHTAFDQVRIPKGHMEILVYDRSTRTRVFQLDLGSAAERVDFDLSPDGSVLAILVGNTVRLYQLPA